MGKHTPGPWRVGDAGYTVFGPKSDAVSPETIAKVRKGTPNARLIAAAPDLLAAAERVAEGIMQGRYPELQGAASDLFAAISRARGEE